MRNNELQSEILCALYGTIHAPDSSMEGEMTANRTSRQVVSGRVNGLGFNAETILGFCGLEGE